MKKINIQNRIPLGYVHNTPIGYWFTNRIERNGFEWNRNVNRAFRYHKKHKHLMDYNPFTGNYEKHNMYVMDSRRWIYEFGSILNKNRTKYVPLFFGIDMSHKEE